MDRRTDDATTAILLTQRLVDVGADPLPAGKIWALVERVPALGVLGGLSVDEVAGLLGGDDALAEQIVQRLESEAAATFALDEFELAGFRVITPFDDTFPPGLCDRLGTSTPPILYVAGDPALLAGPLIGLVGSRNVDVAGAESTQRFVAEAAINGHGVVSGGARGVDQISMNAAFECEVPVVGVLADSLVRMTRDATVRQAVLDGRATFCTPYKPTAGFSVGNAMGRNKIVYGLSATTVVIATDSGTGGTWAGATEALAKRFAPVVVWTGTGSGRANRELVGRGARAVEDATGLFPLEDLPAPGITAGRDPDADDQLALWS